jgi:tetratricopeptide (TPR) repeat protein
VPRSRHLTAAAPLLALLLALAWAGLAAAERSPYTLDTDPLRLGLKSLEAGRLQEARARFEEAVAHNHQVPRALFGLGRIADLEGRYDEAEAAYRRALEAGGDPAAIRARLGLVLLRAGRDREAAAEFDAALVAEPKLWEAHYGRARLLLAQQMWDAAQKELERGKGRQGVAEGEDLYHHGLALLQSGRGDLPAAELSALRALHLNPGDPQYGALVGEIYERRGSPALAIDAFEQALNSPGMIPTAPMLRSLGGLYRKVERYDEARDSYLRAAAIDSTYTPALRDLADLLRAAKRYDQAARTYLRCAMLDPDDIGAHLGVAFCCLELRNFGQAAASADAARALDPQREDAKFLYARAALRGDDAARAAAAALMAQMPTPPAGYAWAVDDYTALADWLAGQKRFDEAAAALASAAALDPRGPERALPDRRRGPAPGRRQGGSRPLPRGDRPEPRRAGLPPELRHRPVPVVALRRGDPLVPPRARAESRFDRGPPAAGPDPRLARRRRRGRGRVPPRPLGRTAERQGPARPRFLPAAPRRLRGRR